MQPRTDQRTALGQFQTAEDLVSNCSLEKSKALLYEQMPFVICNLSTGNIAQLIMTSGTLHSCFDNIFHHIFHVAAHIAKLVLGMHFELPFWRNGRLYGIGDGTIQKSDSGFL